MKLLLEKNKKMEIERSENINMSKQDYQIVLEKVKNEEQITKQTILDCASKNCSEIEVQGKIEA